MNVKPLIGLDDIRLGQSRDQILMLLGEPESKKTYRWPNDKNLESWVYEWKELELEFDEDNGFLLTNICVSNDNVMLDGVKPIGLSEDELLVKLPLLKSADDKPTNSLVYEYPQKELMFWLEDRVVTKISILPQYDPQGDRPLWPDA